MKKVAIIQSSFLPWRGYFDIIKSVDEFIFLDSVQFTRRDWRSRNKIKTQHGTKWLSVPCKSKGKFVSNIKDIETDGIRWKKSHIDTITGCYKRSKEFDTFMPLLTSIYDLEKQDYLSDFNIRLISAVCNYLGIETVIKQDFDLPIETNKNDRLLYICQRANADIYVSGPSAKHYIDKSQFRRNGLDVEFFEYSIARPYNQPWGDFSPNLSIIDLIFNLGRDARLFL